MILLAVLAELADLATYSPAREHNPLVLELGGAAPLAKLLLLVAIVFIAGVLGRLPDGRSRTTRRVLLGTTIVVSALGAWTNLA